MIYINHKNSTKIKVISSPNLRHIPTGVVSDYTHARNTMATISTQKKLCQSLLTKNLYSITHEKLSVILSNSITEQLKQYCRSDTMKQTSEILKFLQDCLSFPAPAKPVINGKCYCIHWVRHPLQSILSAYFYRLNTMDNWDTFRTIKDEPPIVNYIDTNSLYTDIIENVINSESHFLKYFLQSGGSIKTERAHSFIRCFDIDDDSLLGRYLHDFRENTIINNKDYQLTDDVIKELSLSQWYRKLSKVSRHKDGENEPSLQEVLMKEWIDDITIDYSIGIFWEFVRYFNCEWSVMFIFYSKLW